MSRCCSVTTFPRVPFGGPPPATPELPAPALAAGAAVVAGAGALYLRQRHKGDENPSAGAGT